MSDLERAKFILREKDCPFFSDDEIEMYLGLQPGDFEKAIYNMLVLKAQCSKLSLSGMTLEDTSAYWLRLATMYRPSCTRVV